MEKTEQNTVNHILSVADYKGMQFMKVINLSSHLAVFNSRKYLLKSKRSIK